MMTALSARSFFDSSCLHVLFRNCGSRMSGWFLPSKNCRGSEAIRQAAQPENPNCRLYDQNCITGLFSKLLFFHLFFYELDFDFLFFGFSFFHLCSSILRSLFFLPACMFSNSFADGPETDRKKARNRNRCFRFLTEKQYETITEKVTENRFHSAGVFDTPEQLPV